MTRRKSPKPSGKSVALRKADSSPVTKFHKDNRWQTSLLMFFSLLLLLAVSASYYRFKHQSRLETVAESDQQTLRSNVEPSYVGAEQCRQCHDKEFNGWMASHHAKAMQPANPDAVLGDFNNALFRYNGVESTFFTRDRRYFVRTDGLDGQPTEYPIQYTFGVTPLQQYLIEFPGGRLQALSIAWDSRPKSEGGQRWFHLYPNEKIDFNDQLHWTRRYQNWNLQCAECHSTHLEKNYDLATDTYQTRFSEINVACEACHGPASNHLQWANGKRTDNARNNNKGLLLRLQSHWETWRFKDATARYAHSDHPADESLMKSCWACHARRSTLAEGALPGGPLEDSHRPALLTQPTYYADGQQRDEDYTWGSFRQSKMFQNGVTCLDCHEPHGLKLRAEGNALCTRCHKAPEFDAGDHHFHQAGSSGAQCVNCHAPERNYMVIDGRRDHSFRVPRPDLSGPLQTPNACTDCHKDRKPSWASAALDRWLGKSWRNRPEYGSALHAGATQGLKALPSLLRLAQDPAIPSVVRATAASLAQASMQPESLPAAQALLTDTDPSVRIAAAAMLEAFPLETRVSALAPLLADPIRGVRIEAARILADASNESIPVDAFDSFNNAADEYLLSLKQQADWPVENVNMGNFHLRQGRVADAIASYRRALKLDPQFVGAYVNLADAFRQQGRDDEGERLLREGLTVLPNAADLHHALGLLLVRKHDPSTALKELAKAARLAPNTARFAYVYGIALNSSGKKLQALSVLKSADLLNPNNMDILSALISIARETGDRKTALIYAKKAGEALPDNGEIKQLIAELEALRQH